MAAASVSAVDRKSVVLFLLVLVVCALFLGNAVTAAVRDRRSQLAVLACLGWPAKWIGQVILGEVVLIGAGAGVLSLGVSAFAAWLAGVRLTWWHTLLAVPIAIGLSLLAGVAPALRAARSHPADALRPLVDKAKRSRRPRSVAGLGLRNLRRRPGRTVLGAGALAIGVAALTLVTAVTYAFQGAVVGSVLGDLAALRVRGADAFAVAATVLLGAFAVADVMYLNVRDRSAELATLRATGWTRRALSRLACAEGAACGAAGATIGAAAGLGGAAWFTGTLPAALLLTAVIAALTGVAVAAVAALVPALLLHRQPIAVHLAEE